jgi:hypothetical protein
VPLSTDLSISCCRVILAVFFFLGPFVRSAGATAVEAGAGVVAGGLVVASAAVVSDPELDAFCAIALEVETRHLGCYLFV